MVSGLAEAARQLARDALATIAGVLHDCGGLLQHDDDD